MTTTTVLPTTTTTTLPNVVATLCPTTPLATCRSSASQRSALVLRGGATPSKHLLKWKIARGGHAMEADLGDPTGATTLGICLYDASASPQPPIARKVLPGGTCGSRPCWKAVPGGYRYRNKLGSGDGVTDVKLRVRGAGEIALLVKGKGAALDVPSLDFLPPVRLQLLASDADGVTCWESTFAHAIRSEPALFKANGS